MRYLYFLLFPMVVLLNSATQVQYLENENEEFERNQDSDTTSYFWHPEIKNLPKKYWELSGVVTSNDRNKLRTNHKSKGLQHHLMAQSLAGLVNRAVKEGDSETAIWLQTKENHKSYNLSKHSLGKMGVERQGIQSSFQLLSKEYQNANDVKVNVKDHVEGFVLTDVVNNPESNIVASVASHVFNSIIVDVRDQHFYEDMGYKMTYDATDKTTQDAWKEFKKYCSNKALVIMPVQTGELREFAITNNLFVLNLNKAYKTSQAGQNIELLEEVLQWLEPNSPVYGWEQGVGEDQFVNKVSRSGNIMIPYDWAYNTGLTSINYSNRERSQVENLDPQQLDFNEKNKNYVSFYLSDGDNIQWMLNGFAENEFYQHPASSELKMSYGLPMDNLTMIAPDMAQYLVSNKPSGTSVVQTFGGGYNYVDNYAELKDRKLNLPIIANATSAHMRKNNINVLALMSKNATSMEAKEAYRKYIGSNDELLGIIAVQYAPYAGGKGEIMWFKNTEGIQIPVITIKYSVWNFGDRNSENEGTPNYIAQKLNKDTTNNHFNMVMVHAWSSFNKGNESNDLLNQNARGGDIRGAGAAALVKDVLHEDYKVVNVEELIWRLRMHHFPEETKNSINIYNHKG